MGRPKKSKAALLAKLSKNKANAKNQIKNENDDCNDSKLNSSPSTFNENTDNFFVHKSDCSKEISKVKVIIPVRNNLNDASSNVIKQKMSSSDGSKRQVKKICISGNFNQGNIERYGYFAGKQCVANSLLCIIYSKIMNFRLWTSSTLDKILDLGNEYYQYLQSQPNILHDYIME